MGTFIGSLRYDKFASAGRATGSSDLRVVRQQILDVVQDARNDPPRAGGTVLRDIGSERDEVLDRFRRPDDVHVADRFEDSPFALTAPGLDPVLDLFMRNALAAVERGHGSLDAGDLPLVHLEIIA